jgi:hypothetical protein
VRQTDEALRGEILWVWVRLATDRLPFSGISWAFSVSLVCRATYKNIRQVAGHEQARLAFLIRPF